MDEEQCDLDELQALLEAEDDMREENSESHTVRVKPQADLTRSMEDFLQESSDSEDEACKEKDKDKSGRISSSGPTDDPDVLASLMDDDDPDVNEIDAVVEKAVKQEKSLAPKANEKDRNKMKSVDSSSKSKNSSKKDERHKSVKQNLSPSSQKVQVNSSSSSQSSDVNLGSQNETDLLRAQMAQMQQQMLELQKMLAQQQQQPLTQQPAPKHSEKKKSIFFQENTASSSSKSPPNSSSTSPPNSSRKSSKVFSEKAPDAGRSFQLVSDDGDNLFFKGASSSSANKMKSASVNKACSGSQQKGKSKKAEMSRELFGDSDSDWEGLDGEDKRSLSEAGKDIKRLITSGECKREAHQPKYKMNESAYPKSQSWSAHSSVDEESRLSQNSNLQKKVDKNSLQCKSSSSEQKQAKSSGATETEEKFVVEDYSKIRIVNPLVSSYMMRTRMEGRKMIGVSKIHLKLKTPDLQGDWVTIAVMVGKTEAKASKTGKPYSIWKLNDLDDLDNSVSFFLFGEVYKTHWKLEVGTVIGVLNPSIMESMDRNNSEPAFTIKNSNQLMIMGRSKDLGWCIGRTKKGNKCSHFINKKFGEYCAYHVQAEYRRTSAKRLELHGSITGVKPKSFEKKIFSKDCAYMYGGCTYVPNSSASNGNKSKKGLTLAKLQQAAPKGQVNTLSIHNIKAQSGSAATGNKGNVRPASTSTSRLMEDGEVAFADMVAVPSPGSMNLVAFLKNREEKKGKATRAGSSTGTSSPKPSPIQSVTPKELIKQHQQEMKQKQAERKRAAAVAAVAEAEKKIQKVDPLMERPVLGKGFYSGQDISLEVKKSPATAADRAKLKAIAAVQGKGGIKKEDPNAVKSEKDVDKIKKRVQKETGQGSSGEESSSSSSSAGSSRPSTSSSSAVKEPPKKKSRLLGNVDLNSDEIKAILKARSKHQGALTEAELEREDAYFTALEKKEKLEEKMQSVTSIEVSLFTCKQCQYTAQHALDSCRKEGHVISKSKAKKRFFVCRKCKYRTSVVGGKFPTESCKKCGSASYEKTSMYQEKSGPKLASETLSLRGDEVKYLNSLDQKVFLNTVEDD
ncbi:protein MCM10 homolog [Aplysia californica]|uniref:Protein MCM10 homolog n=1 Tax=Aplysia californica TaxID=6500 RepID=A0ABM0K4Y2_APLCA|nr:protein MCM10 homolog [Aplysia californica]XP_005108861.1 protein MCM10 homolog [Aplysia californica]